MSRPIRTLIVDDEPAARDAIRHLLAGDAEIEVTGECADGRSALDAIRESEPDLLFLDIQMPELDGLTLLRQVDPAQLPVVVFVTAYDQYALRAFEVHALDYLLKPFDDERFAETLARAKEHVRRQRLGAISQRLLALLDGVGLAPREAQHEAHVKRLVIKADGRITLVPVADVDWFEADGDYVRIRAGRAQYQLRQTLKSLEAELDPQRFVRIHRSTIVNIDRIKELQPYFRGEYVVILHNGASLKLSRGCKPGLEAALGRSF